MSTKTEPRAGTRGDGAAMSEVDRASENHADFVAVCEWDWVQVGHSGAVTLHCVAESRPGLAPFAYASALGRTVCGYDGYLEIPGIVSRMTAPRCARCSDLLGWPRGVGSPKNDEALRPLVEARAARQDTKGD